MTDSLDEQTPSRKERPNKTKLKKEAHALTDFAKQLAELSESERETLELPEQLTRALNEFIKTTSFVAKKRQGQYLGKVMRALPEESKEIISQKAEALFAEKKGATSSFHQLEHWREKLLQEEGNGPLTEFIGLYPNTDRQKLRHLIQKAKKDLKTGKNLGNAKSLFRYLREVTESSSIS